jgi:hypothetical protein
MKDLDPQISQIEENRRWWEDVEAAIGIEPMNKGFAVLKSELSRVWSYVELCPFVGLFSNSS